MSDPSPFAVLGAAALDPAKFRDPLMTKRREKRAEVAMTGLTTLWFNTGTLCNLACRTCYIESSPRNDALVYLGLAEVEAYLDEARRLGTRDVGFTGGEPFMNPDLIGMLEASLVRGFEVLVLTNAMRPMRRYEDQLLALRDAHGERLTMRVSLDHYSKPIHEAERGTGTWDKALAGCRWLSTQGFRLAVAGRHLPGESETEARSGYAALFAAEGLKADATDPAALVLFPEMDATADVPEITSACWGILGKSPSSIMCSSSRMVVKRKGEPRPVVASCTLIPYDPGFTMGQTLEQATKPVRLNHPHCARFCVLGGASCSS